MNEALYVWQIQPPPSEEEMVVLTAALQMLWPEHKSRQSIEPDKSWRFSRRSWYSQFGVFAQQ